MSDRDKIFQNDRTEEGTGTFSVQLYSDDGQLIGECALDPVKDNISALYAAEKSTCSDMVANDLGSTIIIVSQETLTKLRQVQITVAADSGYRVFAELCSVRNQVRRASLRENPRLI